jgi:hypothetical protein
LKTAFKGFGQTIAKEKSDNTDPCSHDCDHELGINIAKDVKIGLTNNGGA